MNSDGDRDLVRQIVRREHLTGPQFWVENPDHPIHQRYQVKAWPTTYVLDSHGIIRFQPSHPEQIGQAVEVLLREMGHDPGPHIASAPGK